MNTKTLRILIAGNVLWVIIIFILCSLPGEDIPDPHWNIPHLDKVVHFGMFFILSLLLVCPLEYYSALSVKKIYAIAVAVAFVYGGGIELLQHYFFNRGGDVWDLAADLAGAIAGCLCYPLLKRLLRKKSSAMPS